MMMRKRMKIQKTLVKTKGAIWCLLIVAFLFSFIASSFFNDHVKDAAKEFYLSQKNSAIELKNSDIIPIDYVIEKNKYITQSIDPQLIVENVNCSINQIKIFFSARLRQPIDIQLYYTMGEEDFNEENVIAYHADTDATEVSIPFQGQDIQDLRIDIGTERNLEFSLDKIVVNEKTGIKEFLQTWIKEVKNTSFTGLYLNRMFLMALLFIFIGLHFVLNIQDMYQFLFKKRWLVAGVILFFLVINKYNGDSLAMYDLYIQPDEGSQYVEPILGKPRAIRSDEWIVTNPGKLGILKTGNLLHKYSSVNRGTKTLNILYDMHLGVAMIAKSPWNIIYGILPLEYAYSFAWYFPIILTFMLSIEMGLIITKKHKLLSVAGAALLGFSPWYQWWGFPCHLLAAQGCIVCLYHFLNTSRCKNKILFSMGWTVLFSVFVTNLYPAHQVPIGYLFLAILIWLIYENREKIKKLSKREIIIILASFVLIIILIGGYLIEIREYTEIITNTVYPGKRRIAGGNALKKYFYYISAILFPFKDIGNPSEYSSMICFFPMPLILGWIMFIKQKKKDWFLGGICIVISYLLIYTITALPNWLAKITLINFSFPERVVDIVNWGMVYLVLRICSYEYKADSITFKYFIRCCIVFFIPLAAVIFQQQFPEYLQDSEIALLVILVIFYIVCAECLFVELNRKRKQMVLIMLIIISALAGGTVRPIQKGLDAIYSKPVAAEILRLTCMDKDAKWLSYNSMINSSFLVACGAPTLDSVNSYPNLRLWHLLDEKRQYEEIYNRYAHIAVEFINGDTAFELIQTDYMKLKLSYKDVKKTGSSYVFATQSLDGMENQYVDFQMIYAESGSYIYKIIYKQ